MSPPHSNLPTANSDVDYPQRSVEPMDPRITSIQPGGGFVMQLELAWGGIRRACLRLFRRGYLRQMEALRQGDRNPCPHPVLDPRDLKFYRNQPGWHWKPEDDPFRWRDRIPFARAGLAELLFFSVLFFGSAGLLAWLASSRGDTGVGGVALWLLVDALLVIGALIVWFFRDPERPIPTDPNLVVSPADGTVSSIDEIPHDEFIGGPAVQVGLFLSIFNVHINRSPAASRVIGLSYRKGKFLNALRPESARENEQLAIHLQGTTAPGRPMIVRQIAGAIARRIVCWLKPGDELAAGERVGMIKLGSRTEIVLPQEEGLEVLVSIGQKLKAGSSVVARYASCKDRTGE
ncbi:MAG: phosphatidylserine decarboxylase family protein [Planctomycetaceae bacterium]